MADRAIRRKSLFLTAFAPIKISLDKVVRDKLEPGKFPLTKTAWIKVIAMLISLAGLGLFSGQSWDSCANKPDYFLILFPVCIAAKICCELVFYLIFSFGWAVKSPGAWIKSDIILNAVFSVITIVAAVISIVAHVKCKENADFHQTPLYVGIVGSGLTLVGCAAIFLMYRYVEDDAVDGLHPDNSQENHVGKPAARKSVFA